MKRIALIVAVGSLLATPVVFAQSAAQSLLPPSATTAETSSRDTDLHVPRSDDALAKPKSGVQNICIPPNGSTVTGSFEDPTVGDPHFGNESAVTGSFWEPTTP
jgi:hypothetical protein